MKWPLIPPPSLLLWHHPHMKSAKILGIFEPLVPYPLVCVQPLTYYFKLCATSLTKSTFRGPPPSGNVICGWPHGPCSLTDHARQPSQSGGRRRRARYRRRERRRRRKEEVNFIAAPSPSPPLSKWDHMGHTRSTEAGKPGMEWRAGIPILTGKWRKLPRVTWYTYTEYAIFSLVL